MNNNSLQEQLNTLVPLKGFMYAILADARINFLLASVPPQDDTDIEELTIQASTILKSDIAVSMALGIPDETQSIIITSENEVRIFYKILSLDNYVFIMVALRKNTCNIALALHQLHTIEPHIKL